MSTYWVSPSGSDSNAGSASSPFATLQHSMMSLKPGDTLDVESGTYAGFVAGWDSTPASSGDPYGTIDGTAGNPITIQAASNASPGSVIINAKDNKTQFGIDLEPGCNYITISGITVNGSSGGLAEYPNHGGGIKVAGNNDIVANSTITNINYGFGIIADNANDVLLQGNSISNIQNQGNGDYGHGIYLSGTNTGAVINGNTIFNNAYIGIHVNGDVSEGGTGRVTNALIENNLIYNNGQNGINADGLQNSTIENNLIYNYTSYGICMYQSDAGGPSINNMIVNNTIDSGTSTGTDGAIRILDSSTGNTILNNILEDGSTIAYRIAANSISGTVSNHNVVPSGAQVQSDDTGADEPFSQWQSSTGQDHNSLTATPAQLFVSPSANNYQELSPSPSIGAGTSTDAPSTDMLGNPRPSSNGYDIGCYEYETGTPSAPAVTSLSPTSGPAAGGTSVMITGTRFTGATVVDFGTKAATDLTVVNSTTITADSPAGTGTVNVTVTTPVGTSATSTADQFTYSTAAPTVTGLNPASGPAAGGTSVTIAGTGFTGATTVHFGTTPATDLTVVNSTTITADSPAGTGTVNVTVTTPVGTSATSTADQFTYAAPPPTPTSIRIGDTTIESTNDSGNGNLLVVQKVTLSQAATIQSLSFYVNALGGQLRLGLYANNAGSPGALKASTNQFTATSTGWNTQNVVTPVSLTAGTYWLAYLPQSNSLGFKVSNNGSGTAHWINFNYGPLPATFPSGGSSGGSVQWSFYATLNTAPTPTPTATPANELVSLVNAAQIPNQPSSQTVQTSPSSVTVNNGGALLAASGNGDPSASSAALQSSAESDVQDAAVASLVSGSPTGILPPESLVNALAQDRLHSKVVALEAGDQGGLGA